MNKSSLLLFLSVTAPLMSADDDSKKIGWPSYRPTKPIVWTPQPPQPIKEQYPITFGLLLAEIKRTSVETILERARAIAKNHAPVKGINAYGMPFVTHGPDLLVLENNFDETMQEPLAQKIIALVTQKEIQSVPDIEYKDNAVKFNLGQRELDKFTKYDTHTEYDAQSEGSIRFVKCITTLYKMSDLETLLAEAEEGKNQ